MNYINYEKPIRNKSKIIKYPQIIIRRAPVIGRGSVQYVGYVNTLAVKELRLENENTISLAYDPKEKQLKIEFKPCDNIYTLRLHQQILSNSVKKNSRSFSLTGFFQEFDLDLTSDRVVLDVKVVKNSTHVLLDLSEKVVSVGSNG